MTVDLPIGADTSVEYNYNWQPAEPDYPAYRTVWSPYFDEKAGIRAVATQLADGTLCTDGDDAPHVYIDMDAYTPADARALAAALTAAANLADLWASLARGIRAVGAVR